MATQKEKAERFRALREGPGACGHSRHASVTRLEIRAAGPEDASAVAHTLLASRRTFLPYLPSPRADEGVRRWIREIVLPGGGVSVALLDGRVAGFIDVHREDGTTWVRQLYLLPQYVSQGVDSALLGHALAVAARPVRLWCFQRNTDARRFYERHGFVAIRNTDGAENEERTPDVLYEMRIMGSVPN